MLRQQSALRHAENVFKNRSALRRTFILGPANNGLVCAGAGSAMEKRLYHESSPSKYIWPIEEETLPKYRAEAYFPAHLGQVLQNRYRIVGKLGFGINSTMWLSWDDRCVERHEERQ